MDKSEFLELNLPSRDNATDIADINAISDNFRTIDSAFLDLVENEIPELQTKENINLNFDDDSINEEQYPSVSAVVNFTNRKIDPLKIVNSASGNAIALKDSANDKLVNLKLYGKTTQNGTPTPSAPVPLVSVGDSGSFEVGVFGKNLFNNTGVNNTLNGLTITVNADKSVTVFGTATATTTYNMGEIGNLIRGQSYTPINGLCCRVQLVDSSILYVNSNITFTYTDEISKMYAYMSFSNGAKVNATYYPMLVLATETDDTYEQYKAKQTLTMPYTLRGVGDIADEIDFTRGVKIQRFSEVDLGTLTWGYDGSEGIRTFYASYPTLKPAGMSVCAKYKGVTSVTAFLNEQNVIYLGNVTQPQSINVRTDVTYTDTNAFKSAMSGTMLVYELADPIETPLTEIELNAYKQLHTNKPNTTILSEAEMEVSYVADSKNYIDNKIAELTALTLEG